MRLDSFDCVCHQSYGAFRTRIQLAIHALVPQCGETDMTKGTLLTLLLNVCDVAWRLLVEPWPAMRFK